jgi:hypothetical protein
MTQRVNLDLLSNINAQYCDISCKIETDIITHYGDNLQDYLSMLVQTLMMQQELINKQQIMLIELYYPMAPRKEYGRE